LLRVHVLAGVDPVTRGGDTSARRSRDRSARPPPGREGDGSRPTGDRRPAHRV